MSIRHDTVLRAKKLTTFGDHAKLSRYLRTYICNEKIMSSVRQYKWCTSAGASEECEQKKEREKPCNTKSETSKVPHIPGPHIVRGLGGGRGILCFDDPL